MWFTSLRKSLRSTPPYRSPARRRSSVILYCETLETRWIPTTVTNLNDAGAGSLRQALLDTPSGGVVDFASGLSGTIVLTSAELTVGRDLTIQGPEDYGITVSGDNARRVFHIPAGRTVGIGRLNIVNGLVTAANATGGGILNEGQLDLVASVVRNNQAIGVSTYGGGIRNSGTLLLLYTNISNNSVTATGSLAIGGGGGIDNTGTLTVQESYVAGNTVTGSGGPGSTHRGAGIYNWGTLAVLRSTVQGNSVTGSASGILGGWGSGGGIYNNGLAGVGESTISDNQVTMSGRSSASGGGVYTGGGGYMTILSSTVSGNAAVSTQVTPRAGEGGGIANAGILHVIGSTVTRNTANAAGISRASGGGIATMGDGMTLRNTIVAGNTGQTGADVFGPLGSLGHNLVGDGTSGEGFAATDLIGTLEAPLDPLLGPLDYNGGYTLTHALLPGSPAIDQGDPTTMPEWDQRGDGYARIVGANIDIGAYEYDGFGGGPGGGAARAPTPAPVWIASHEADLASMFRMPRQARDTLFAQYDDALFIR